MILIFEVWITKMQNISLLVDLTLIYVRLPGPHLLSFITAIAQKSINKTCTLHVLSEKMTKTTLFQCDILLLKCMPSLCIHICWVSFQVDFPSSFLIISSQLDCSWDFMQPDQRLPFWNASGLCLHCNLCGWVQQDRVALKFNGFKGHFILATHRPATNCPGDMNTRPKMILNKTPLKLH